MQDPALQQDALTPSDWATLVETCRFLEPFQDAIMANEGSRNSICDVLPTMDYLLYYIETSRETTAVPYLAIMMETAWVGSGRQHARQHLSSRERLPEFALSIITRIIPLLKDFGSHNPTT